MKKIELVQQIGNSVCEECNEGADCGEKPEECGRIINAVNLVDQYMAEQEQETP